MGLLKPHKPGRERRGVVVGSGGARGLEPLRRVEVKVWRSLSATASTRTIPEETAIAITYNGASYAVMMATPQDLEDFAVGFSLNEGIVSAAADVADLRIIETELGIEARIWLTEPRAAILAERRRHIAGPTGCGLCGIESLTQAMRLPPRVRARGKFAPSDVMWALKQLTSRQTINHATRAVHAAAFFAPESRHLVVREDVGRHNALDKLAGALARGQVATQTGMILLTSRVSIEMVQKAAVIGAPVLVAVSAPTALALRMAQAAGLTLLAVARPDGFEIFSHAERIISDGATDAG